MNEFEVIARFFRPLSRDGTGVRIGIGDDGAVLNGIRDRELVVTTDTIVSGIHFPADCPAGAVGHRALAVNLSDLAAMGADPAWYTLSLALPKVQTHWLRAFTRGLDRLAQRASIHLVGGDTVRSPVLSVTVTAFGLVPRGQVFLRSTARPGDRIFVSGPLGLAAQGLARWQGGQRRSRRLRPFLYPEPKLDWIRVLRRDVRCAIDISDGFAQDLGHLLEASRVGAVVDLDRIPRDRRDPIALDRALFGGDDYELCFTIPDTRLATLRARTRRAGLEGFEVGRVVPGRGIRWQRADGSSASRIKGRGFDHFAKPTTRR